MSETVGIILAMPQESVFLLELLKAQKVLKLGSTEYYASKLGEKKCFISIGGVGKVNSAICAQNMILRFSVNNILNIGLAGSSCKTVRVGDIIVSKNTVQHDVDTSALGDEPGMISTINLVNIPCCEKISRKIYENISTSFKAFLGTIASGDKFISDRKELEKIHEQFGAIAVDMEAGSIAQTCYLNKVKFASVKIISDSAFESEDSTKNYIKNKQSFPEILCNLIYKIIPNIF